MTRTGARIWSFDRALRMSPLLVVALVSSGVMGSGGVAHASGQKVDKKKLQRAVMHHLRACTLEDQGNVGEAVNEIREALREDPDEPYWYQQLGADLEKGGKPQEALDAYNRATQLSPDDLELRSELQDLQKRSSADNTTGAAPKSVQDTPLFTPAKDTSPPRSIYQPDPQYSEKARLAKYSGVVILEIVVDAQGSVVQIRDVRPIGLGLDEKAIEAVRNWRFQPAMRDGTPLATRVGVEVFFRLLPNH